MAKQKVAILGGGPASLAAAFALTSVKGWKRRYEITVYQMGWRLGGKGASGRGTNDRIEEHGLHVWFGFYENAFKLMRDCYAELRRRKGMPLQTVHDAFTPCELVGQVEYLKDVEFVPLVLPNPRNSDFPGEGQPYPTPLEYLQALADFTQQTIRQAVDSLTEKETVLGLVSSSFDVVKELLSGGGVLGGAQHLDQIRAAIEHLLARVENNPGIHNVATMVDLALGFLRGILADQVFQKGFDHLDDMEFSDWLKSHGVLQKTIDSAFVRGTYDGVFGFHHGDPKKPVLAAGVGLRSGMRMMFGYKGAFLYKMMAGMGDVVFAPLYLVLKKRGVRFEFFHRVESLHLSPDKRRIERIELTRQVRLKNGTYDPLIDVNRLPCWPNAPLYDQLSDGEELKTRAAAGENVSLESAWSAWDRGAPVTLRDGADFNRVVLGIPVACHSTICRELIDHSQAWKDMVEKTESIRTMASQVWLDKSLEELGWLKGPPMVSAFLRPLSTYADLSHLTAREQFPKGQQPRHLAYFCGPMADDPNEAAPGTAPHYPSQQDAVVKETTRKLLQDNSPASLRGPMPDDIRVFWPKFTWDFLSDPAGKADEQRLDAQFFRANIDATERYVLSVPGATKYRLKADESGFANLVLAGDWTANGLNAGCIEAAVMSGLQAARAIDCVGGKDRPIYGEIDGEIPLSLWGLAPGAAKARITRGILPFLCGPYGNMTDCRESLHALHDHLWKYKDRRAVFLGAYLQITRAVAAAIAAGKFQNGPAVEQYLLHFAELYRRAFEAFESARHHEVPQAWAIAFDVSAQRSGLVLQDLMLGMNAHINYDLPLALAQLSIDGVALRHDDHLLINPILRKEIGPIQRSIASHYDPILKVLDFMAGDFDEWLTGATIEAARNLAWARGQQLCEVRRDTARFDSMRQEVDRNAALVAKMIRFPGHYGFAVKLMQRLESQLDDWRSLLPAVARLI